MNAFKKFKQFISSQSDANKTSTQDEPNSKQNAEQSTAQNNTITSSDEKATAHLSAISSRIQNWLDSQDWHYEHYPPDDDDDLRTHHFVMGFRDNDFHWSCIIRVHEKNQLITFQGLIPEPVATPYYLPIMAIFTATNYNLSIGSLEFDVNSGIARAKIGIDGEFSRLSDTALSCYLQGIAGLTEKAAELIAAILQDPNPNQNLVEVLMEQGILKAPNETIENDKSYFLIGETLQ